MQRLGNSKRMTPLEIFDHKRKWMMKSHYEHETHTDLRSEGLDWCKKNCEKHQWSMKSFTDIYGDTFNFEREEDYNNFMEWYIKRRGRSGYE